MVRPHPWPLLGLACLALVGGCGGAAHPAHRPPAAGQAPTAGSPGPLTLPAPKPTGAAPTSGDVAVIRGWADALRHGDVRLAARYFALPSVLVNGPDASGHALVWNIVNEAQAVAANTALPCGATLASTDQRGPYVNALFSLGGRPGPGGGCQGQQGTARVNFVIHAGRIVHWLRAPDDAGDHTTGPGGVPPRGSGGGTSTAAPV